MPKSKGGLGKGLEALFADNNTEIETPTSLSLSEIEPNRNQPRKFFEATALSDLADSIKEYGVLQPLLVRPIPNGSYQLVAGERRWRAARMAGLSQVPVIIRELTDKQAMELALIENLQREDLNAIEEATGYRELMDKFGLTQEQVSQRVGKSRPVVTNAMRLLNLPPQVQQMLENLQITPGHARALLSLEEADTIIELALEIVNRGLSVRQVESISKKKREDKKAATKKSVWNNSFFSEVQISLGQSLARKVKVEGDGKTGRVVIEFYGEDDLKTLINSFKSEY